MSEIMQMGQLTMSSLEIADLTGKQHSHVMRDIRLMLVGLYGEDRVSSFGQTVERPNPSGGAPIRSPAFLLPKRETLVLVSGYSLTFRARIIDRWQELEAAAANPFLSMDRLGLLRAALESEERVAALKAEVQAAAPKVVFFDTVSKAGRGQTIEEVAKVLGTGRNRFFGWLRDEHYLMPNNRPYQRFIDAGHFVVKEKTRLDLNDEPIAYTQTLVTGRGFQMLSEAWTEARATWPILTGVRALGGN